MHAMMQRRNDAASVASVRTGTHQSQRVASVRTAWILGSIAAAFFAGVIIAQYSGSPSVGIAVLGFAILGFLIVSIGRNIRK